MDSLNATRRSVAQVQGDLSTDLYNIQQQLVQLQELTGQSQQRLTELRTRLEARGAQIETAARPRSGRQRAAHAGSGGTASADQMYEASLAQLRRGSLSHRPPRLAGDAAPVPHQRAGAGRALFHRPELRRRRIPIRRPAYYRQVVDKYPASPRAASALYNLGLLAERRKDMARRPGRVPAGDAEVSRSPTRPRWLATD